MDTSETYIKMCDCPEIQEGNGYYHGGYSTKSKTDKQKSFHLSEGWDNWDSYFIKRDNIHTIWLPRQDQIQDMLFAEDLQNGDIGYVVHRLWYFENKGGYNCNSMEQLWLRFYMKEKHNKTWEDGKWI